MTIRSLCTLTFFVHGLATPLLAQEVVYDLGEVVFEAESDTTLVQEGYVVERGRQATKVDTPLLQIPQAITAITIDQIEDQAPRTLNETLVYSSSADPYSFGYDSRFDAFNLRGFPAFYDGIFRDGLRQYNAPTALYKNEPYGLEAITILKGPASSLYGASGPGGIVNLVSKRPKDTRFRELRFGLGEHNRREIAGDFSGPLRADGSVRYRLTALARDSDTHLEGFRDDKLYLAPALTIDTGPNTTLTLLGEISQSVTGAAAVFVNPALGQVSDIYVADPNYNDFTQDQWRFGYEFEHRFTDTVTLRQNFRHSEVEADLEYSGLTSNGLGGFIRNWDHYTEDMTATTVDTMVQFDFETAAASHELLVGLDVTKSDYDSAFARSLVSPAAAAATPLADQGGLEMEQIGIYIHDQITWERLKAFASLRFDQADIDSRDAAGTMRSQDQTGTSARIGVSYEMVSGLTPYFNVSSSFLPVPQLVYDDVTLPVTRPADPTEAVQQEIGVKYKLPGSNSLLSAALFNINADNQLILDATTGVNRARQVNITSRGLELEAMTNFDNGWSVIGSFTHQDVTFSSDDANFAGNRLNAVPKNIAALWLQYDVRQGPMKGLGIGGGIRHAGTSFGDDANTIRNSSRTYVDLALSYALPQARDTVVQANIRNLFDTRKPTCASSFCYRDEGRLVTVSLTRRF